MVIYEEHTYLVMNSYCKKELAKPKEQTKKSQFYNTDEYSKEIYLGLIEF